MAHFILKNENLTEDSTHIVGKVDYHSTKIVESPIVNGTTVPSYEIRPLKQQIEFRTEKRIPKTGVMLVGWAGNNGSTFTGVVLANRQNLSWKTKRGVMHPNYYGSIVKSSTISLGVLPGVDELNATRELCVPMCDLLPTLDPNALEIDGWDINDCDIGSAMKRAEVFEVDLQEKLVPLMSGMRPRKAIFNQDYLASNQGERANNVLTGTVQQQVDAIRADIRDFRSKKNLEKVIVLWTASTERFSDIIPGVNDTKDNILSAINKNNSVDIAPSTLFGVASVLEGCTFINGSPQNTLVPGLVDLAESLRVHLAGDDFKTGQTKVKSSLVEFLIGSGIKPVSIVSYNHLGNNDGRNLKEPKQFRSKEITKSGVIEDMVSTNHVLYKDNEKPDHCIVIKYVPYVADTKRAMDEYISEICMHGLNTLAIHNTCEDSLLATPVMLDLVILAELFQRIHFRIIGPETTTSEFKTILSSLGFLLKSPVSNSGEPSINAFSRQRSCIENIFRSCLGLAPQSHMFLEHKIDITKQNK